MFALLSDTSPYIDNAKIALVQTSKKRVEKDYFQPDDKKVFASSFLLVDTALANLFHIYQNQTVSQVGKADLEDDFTDIYIKLQPIQKFMVRGKVKSLKKGEIKIFQDEFEL